MPVVVPVVTKVDIKSANLPPQVGNLAFELANSQSSYPLADAYFNSKNQTLEALRFFRQLLKGNIITEPRLFITLSFLTQVAQIEPNKAYRWCEKLLDHQGCKIGKSMRCLQQFSQLATVLADSLPQADKYQLISLVANQYLKLNIFTDHCLRPILDLEKLLANNIKREHILSILDELHLRVEQGDRSGAYHLHSLLKASKNLNPVVSSIIQEKQKYLYSDQEQSLSIAVFLTSVGVFGSLVASGMLVNQIIPGNNLLIGLASLAAFLVYIKQLERLSKKEQPAASPALNDLKSFYAELSN